ncbi:hypothetical protein LVX13_38190 [Streptomyces albulus]|uniref:hypothetical protein n=1 Tax=Streptomyces noursei TaxID=1971 RepID=UPI001F394685|nr:hypothetical protein [Streptomyces noursei]MCE4948879.1 hypothetical protein [Streptomyces noursei]
MVEQVGLSDPVDDGLALLGGVKHASPDEDPLRHAHGALTGRFAIDGSFIHVIPLQVLLLDIRGGASAHALPPRCLDDEAVSL